jgi:ABC-type amino acid transport substrate-binding protein
MKNYVNSFFAYVVVSFITLVMGPGCSRSPSTDTLVVGMMSGWAPFMTLNQQGEFEGFDIDVARQVAMRLGKKLVINDMGSLAPLFIALDQGKIDMVMSGLDNTQARQEALSMVRYAGQDITAFYLLFWGQKPAYVQSIENLSGATVCVEPGSAQEQFLDRFKAINQKSLSKVEDMVLDVKYGKSQAMLVEPQVMTRLKKIAPELVALAVPLPVDFQVFGWGIALKKDNALASNVNAVIQELKRDGTMRVLEQKWGIV